MGSMCDAMNYAIEEPKKNLFEFRGSFYPAKYGFW